ncbi:MAG: hypothetical protein ABWY00_12740 [Dongiaceae bacterium]
MAILWASTKYHLGDNPGVFQDASYIGHHLKLPFRKAWLDPEASTVVLRVHTRDVETWGDCLGHKVSINEREIGRLKDTGDASGDAEVFELGIARSDIEKILAGDDCFTLSIELDVGAAAPRISDDFVVTRIESDGTFAAKLGWK